MKWITLLSGYQVYVVILEDMTNITIQCDETTLNKAKRHENNPVLLFLPSSEWW